MLGGKAPGCHEPPGLRGDESWKRRQHNNRETRREGGEKSWSGYAVLYVKAQKCNLPALRGGVQKKRGINRAKKKTGARGSSALDSRMKGNPERAQQEEGVKRSFSPRVGKRRGN